MCWSYRGLALEQNFFTGENRGEASNRITVNSWAIGWSLSANMSETLSLL
jgi:hypothetical protein